MIPLHTHTHTHTTNACCVFKQENVASDCNIRHKTDSYHHTVLLLWLAYILKLHTIQSFKYTPLQGCTTIAKYSVPHLQEAWYWRQLYYKTRRIWQNLKTTSKNIRPVLKWDGENRTRPRHLSFRSWKCGFEDMGIKSDVCGFHGAVKIRVMTPCRLVHGNEHFREHTVTTFWV